MERSESGESGESGADEGSEPDTTALPAVFRGLSLFMRVPFWSLFGPAFFMGAIVLLADHPWLAAVAMATAIIAFALCAKPTRVAVGADGVSLQWLWWRQFFPRHQIAHLSTYKQGFGRSRLTGVVLRLHDGQRVKIPLEDRHVGVAHRAVREALGAATRDVTAASDAALARGNLSPSAWFSKLRALGADASPHGRVCAVRPDELWRVLANPTAPSLQRAAAAVALRDAGGDELKTKLVRVAEETVDPALRALLERTAASHVDEELEQAFLEFQEKSESS